MVKYELNVEVEIMKKLILIILPLFIGCSFQVKDTPKEEDRLSRRPILEDETYGEFNFDEGFTPHEYQDFIFIPEDEKDNRDRSPRELNLFLDNDNEEYSQENFYRKDISNYEPDEDLKILEKNYNKVDYYFE